MKKILVMFTFSFVTGWVSILTVHAQSYTPLAPIQGLVNPTTGKTDISTYLSGALPLIITLGAVFAILMAILGGVQYVAAGITPDAKGQAKARITRALVGLALILSSYMILNTINPKLLQFSFLLPSISTPTISFLSEVATPTNFSDVDALDLNINTNTKIAAMEIKEQFPNISFTSGRRTMSSQINAMADNIISSGDKDWIRNTPYAGVNTPETCSYMLQSWLDSNPSAVSNKNALLTGLGSIADANPGKCASLSKHLTGRAFDIQPVISGSPTEDQVRQIVESYGGEFKNTEGGLIRWHAEF